MQTSNKAAEDSEPAARTELPDLVDAVLAGSQGFTVRSRPGCRTLMLEHRGDSVFCKLREGERAAAAAEWRWLHVLPMIGLGVPQPLAFERRSGRSLLCTARAPGRPLDALLLEALRHGAHEQVGDFASEVVAPRIRQLHEQGLVYRDLYWNHLYATSLDAGAELTFLDVERVFRPRWRRFRWFVKDLAGLLASLPRPVALRQQMRFLKAYLQDRWSDRWLRRKLGRAVIGKAAKIRRHQPKFG